MFQKIIPLIIFLVAVLSRNSQISFPTNCFTSRIYILPTYLITPQQSIVTWPLSALNLTNFIGLPNAYLALAGLDWYYQNNIQFSFELVNITATIANIHYIVNQVRGLDINIMVFDTLSYNFDSQQVQAILNTLTGTNKQLTIPGHENYQLAYITALKMNVLVNQTVTVTYFRQQNAITNYIQLNMTFDSSKIQIINAKYLLITMNNGQQSPLLFTSNYYYCQPQLTIQNAVINSQILTTYGTILINSKNIFFGLHSITKIIKDSSLTNIAIVNITDIRQAQYTEFLASLIKVFYKKCDNSYRYFDVQTSACLSSCYAGHYLDTVLGCHLCSDSCQNCVENSDNCTSCFDYFTLLNNDTQTVNNSCTCLKLYVSSNNTCNPCTNALDLTYCQYCSDQFTCTKCMESFTLITDPISGTKKICICSGQVIQLSTDKWGCILQAVTQVCPITANINKMTCRCPFNTTFSNSQCQPY